ncbi:MAG: nucleotidyltransferase family protein [Alphaproteobacteria bacterium]|nr:nucleotidyltransferase family protein [Alphaproteobacteria bacterium]
MTHDDPHKPIRRPDVEVPKRAMVLAAGFGTRMRPLTEMLPKPLIEVGGRAMIDRTIDRLEDDGVETVVVNLHHLGHLIEQHLRKRKTPEIVFSQEDKILETGGGVKNALELLGDDPFLVVNSDIMWLNGPTSSLQDLTGVWNDDLMDGLLLLHPTVEAYGYTGMGDFCIDPVGVLSWRPERELAPYLFTGVQILHPRFFDGAPDGPFSLTQLYDRAIENGRLHGMIHEGEWFHIGSPDGLAQAENYMRERYAGIRRR